MSDMNVVSEVQRIECDIRDIIQKVNSDGCSLEDAQYIIDRLNLSIIGMSYLRSLLERNMLDKQETVLNG